VTPPLVREARALSAALGFRYSSTDDVGRLLAALVARVDEGVIAEIGTGCGVGTAWMASALRPGVRLVTVEIDEQRARLVRDVFKALPTVSVLQGDWRAIAAAAPFALLFGDGGGCKDEDLHHLLSPGASIIFDDFTDPEDWPEELRRSGDPRRERWLSDARYASAIVGVGRDKFEAQTRAQAVIATRR
jgi:predicted O-methyltransferase YrrM